MALEVDGFRPFIVPLSAACMELSLATEVTVETEGHGDTAVVIRINPSPEQIVVLERARIDYWGSDADWRRDLEQYRGGVSREFTIWAPTKLILKLSTSSGSQSAAVQDPDDDLTPGQRAALHDALSDAWRSARQGAALPVEALLGAVC